MSIRKIRYFAGFTESQAKWLNSMTAKGYRLVKSGKLQYVFKECEASKYVYTVEYIGDLSFDDAENYKEFLEGLGYSVFYKNINIDYSLLKVTYRPWADKGGRLSANTSKSTYNKELLIVEKENDGKPFQLHTDLSDRIEYCKRLSRPWYFAAFLFLALLIIWWPLLATSIVFGILSLLCITEIVIAACKIHKLSKEKEIEE